jgi:adenylate cyclase
MEPAPELVAFFERFLDLGWGQRPDLEGHLDGFSRLPGTQFIGADPDEWYEEFGPFAAAARVQVPEQMELGGIHLEADRVLAWKEGSVGWIAWRGRFGVGDTDPVEVRISAVVHQDGPHWKVVLCHVAYTTSNREIWGTELTTAVDDLLLSVANEVPPPRGMSADGSVVIMFTDLEDSTALVEALGEARWLELLSWQAEVVTQQTATFGGTVVKGQGDGFMLAFPAAGSATASAIAIQRVISGGWMGVPIAIRIGLHAGNATAEAGDFFGRTVVTAARIANAANAGQILVSEAVQHNLAGAFTLGDPRSLTLKGLSGRFPAFPVIWN